MTEAATPEAVSAAAAAPPVELPSPGRLLRTARERAGLGAEDLAGQLKLAKVTLEALERDDFAALSEPVYIRGYYRKIAKLLGSVSESELIEAYNARTRPAPTQAAAQMRHIPLAGGVAAGTSRQYRGQGIWLVGAVVVVAGFLFAIAQHESPERLKVDEPKAEPAPVASVAPTPEPAATVVPDEAEPKAGAPVPAPTPAPAAASSAPQPTPPTGAATRAPAPATTHASSAAIAAAPAAAPAATSAAAPTAPAPAAPPTQLVLEYTESSFVRVEDGRGKTLAIGLQRSGERQALDGEPPYTVFLGNAQNVKVFYGGRPVDFSPHVNRQNDTARFTVP